MTISLKDLRKLSSVDKVIIHSHDLSLYLVSIVVDGEEHYLVDSEGRPVRSHNKLVLQSLFERHQVKQMVLRQQSAYDEMVGQPPKSGDNTLEVSLGDNKLGGPTSTRLH